MTSHEPLIPGCPHCGSTRRPLLWALASSSGARTYRCLDCRRTWSVDGVQAELFDLGEVETAQLELRS